jgi:WD40 repeat protein
MPAPDPPAAPLADMRAGLRSIVIRLRGRIPEGDGGVVLATMCAGACAPILFARQWTDSLPELHDKGGPLLEKVGHGVLYRLHEELGEHAEATLAEIEEAFTAHFMAVLAVGSDVPERIVDEAADLLLKFDGLQVALDAAVSKGNSALARSIVDQLILLGARYAGARRLISHTLLADSLGFEQSASPAATEPEDEPPEEEKDDPPEPDATLPSEPAPLPEPEAKGLKRWLRSRRVVTGTLIALAVCLVASTALAAVSQLRFDDYRTEIVTERLLEASAEALATDGPLAQSLAAAAWRLDPTDAARAAMSRAYDSPATGEFTSAKDLYFGSVAFNPDGTSFATVGGDGSIELWDTETWEPELLAEDDGVVSLDPPLAFSPDGLRLAAGRYGEPVKVWDLRTREVTELDAGQDASTLVFDPLGEKLAVVGPPSSSEMSFEEPAGTTVTVWDTANWEQTASFSVEITPIAAEFSPSGEELVFATGQDAVLRQFDAATGELTAEQDFTDNEWGASITSFDISPRAPYHYLVCASYCLLWTQSDEGTYEPYVSVDAGIEFAQFSPKADRILSWSYSEGVDVANAADGVALGKLPLAASVDDLAVSPDGLTALALYNGKLQRWSLDRLPAFRAIRPTLSPSNMSMGEDWSLAINTTPEGTETFEGRFGAAPVETFTDHVGLGSAISPDSKVAATLLDSATTTFELWDTASGEPIVTIEDDSAEARYWDFSNDGSMLLAATANLDDGGNTAFADENDVVVWDAATGDELVRVTVGDEWPAESVDVSPDGSTLLTVSGEGTTRLWSIADGGQLAELGGIESQPFNAQFSPDGSAIAAATSDGIAVWNAAHPSAEPRYFDTGFSSGTVAFSPDSTLLAVDESYTTDLEDERPPRVAVLDLDTGAFVAELPITSSFEFYSQLSFSPEGDRLAHIGSDGITIADISHLSGDIYELTCEQVGRELTEDEWRQYLPEFEYRSFDVCP